LCRQKKEKTGEAMGITTPVRLDIDAEVKRVLWQAESPLFTMLGVIAERNGNGA